MSKRLLTIKLDRLTLSPIKEESKDEMIEMFVDEKINKTYMIPTFKNEEEKDNLFLRLKTLSEDENRFVYGIYLNNTLIGQLNEVERKDDTIEIGYYISSKYWNKGYMTEALKGAIKELFRIGFNHVKAAHFEGNDASGRVMQKSGMYLINEEEVVRYKDVDYRCIYYQIDKPHPID